MSLLRTAGANGAGSDSSDRSDAEGDFLLSSDNESEAGPGSEASWSSESSGACVAALFPMRLGSMHEHSGSIDEAPAASMQQLHPRPPLTQSSSIALTDMLTDDEEGDVLPPLPEEWQQQGVEQDDPPEAALQQTATPESLQLPRAPSAQQSLTAKRFSDGPLSSDINARTTPAGGLAPAAAAAPAAPAKLPALRAASRSCHDVQAAAAAPPPPWSGAWSVRSSQSLSDNDRTPAPQAAGVRACSCRTRSRCLMLGAAGTSRWVCVAHIAAPAKPPEGRL